MSQDTVTTTCTTVTIPEPRQTQSQPLASAGRPAPHTAAPVTAAPIPAARVTPAPSTAAPGTAAPRMPRRAPRRLRRGLPGDLPGRRPASALRRWIARLLDDRALTAEDRAHAAAARRSHQPARIEPFEAQLQLARRLQ